MAKTCKNPNAKLGKLTKLKHASVGVNDYTETHTLFICSGAEYVSVAFHN